MLSVTQACLQGDRADRERIRAYDIQREKLARQQAEADERAQLPVTMAREGASVETICRTLDMSKTPYSRDYIERLVADVQQLPEQPEGDSDLVVSKVRISSPKCVYGKLCDIPIWQADLRGVLHWTTPCKISIYHMSFH